MTSKPSEITDELTGEELAESMSDEAQAKAQEELTHLSPGPSEPMRFGEEGARTQLDDDPISEGGSSRESRP